MVSDLLDKVNEKEKEVARNKNQADAIYFFNSAKAKLDKHDFVGARADIKQAISLNSEFIEAKNWASQSILKKENIRRSKNNKTRFTIKQKADR